MGQVFGRDRNLEARLIRRLEVLTSRFSGHKRQDIGPILTTPWRDRDLEMMGFRLVVGCL